MLVAWMTTVSIGVIVARFFKPVLSRPFFGESVWFQVGGRESLMRFPYYLTLLREKTPSTRVSVPFLCVVLLWFGKPNSFLTN